MFNFALLFTALFCLYSCASATEPSRRLSNTVYDLVQEFTSNPNAHAANIDLEIYKRNPRDSKTKHYLRAELKNDTAKALCIPSIFIESGFFVNEDGVVELNYFDGTEIQRLTHPGNLKWPTEHYVFLLPGNDYVSTIELSTLYEFKSNMSGVRAELSIPAFYCESLQNGYPVTAKMFANPVGLTDLFPINSIGDDYVVFSGVAELEW